MFGAKGNEDSMYKYTRVHIYIYTFGRYPYARRFEGISFKLGRFDERTNSHDSDKTSECPEGSTELLEQKYRARKESGRGFVYTYNIILRSFGERAKQRNKHKKKYGEKSEKRESEGRGRNLASRGQESNGFFGERLCPVTRVRERFHSLL